MTDQATSDSVGCLYDGSAKAAAFTEKQLAKVLSAIATAEAVAPAAVPTSPAADERARTDPTDLGLAGGELTMEKYNVAGLGVFPGHIAAVFAATLRAEGVKAMAIHSRENVRAAAANAAVAKFRKGPRLVVIGGAAAVAVRKAGQKLGTEKKSDLFGVVGTGDSADARLSDTVANGGASCADLPCGEEEPQACAETLR